MKHKPGANSSPCKVISFKNYKDKKVKYISSTIAAIIAINIEHPSDTKAEDFFVNKLERIEDIEILAFEDALENSGTSLTPIDAQDSALNDA